MTEDKIILAQDNKLTLSRQNFTTIEKRCLYFIIKEVRRLYVDRNLEEHERTQKTLFSDMYLMLKPNQLQMLGDEVKDVYNALRKLRNREIEIENEEMWLITSWILQAKHSKKANMYEVLVSKDILPDRLPRFTTIYLYIFKHVFRHSNSACLYIIHISIY
jgi:hypothetical protein